MKITNRFDPTTGAATANNTNPQNYLLLPFNSGQLRVFMVNPTGVNVDISFSNGNIAHLPAHSRRWFEENVPSGVIYWQIVGYTGSYPNSTPPFTFEIYEPYEAAPTILPDITPAPQPFGQVLASDFHGTQNPTLTIPNVAGQLSVLDGFDVYIDNSAASGVACTVTVTAGQGAQSGIKFEYFAPTGAAVPNTVDHVSFAPRGLPQVPGTAITVAFVAASTLGTANQSALIIRFHYEINF